jgi:phospholipid/cholesterol/gamma-HCH transport system substrate-binding protein
MKTAIRKNLSNFAAIIGIAVIALAIGGYILAQQGLRFPIVQEEPYELQAEFSTGQAITPGQGQTVRVSGVRVGDISKVRLREGRAIVTMALDPEFDDLVHTDATALLRPKTGLKDMFIELNPGSKTAPPAREGWTMPVRATLPDVNADEVLAALDADTRDYLRLLVGGVSEGLRGRSDDLRDVLKRFEPTHRDIARVSSAVAQRRTNLRRLVNRLDVLNTELGSRSDGLARLVDSSATVLRAFASEQRNLSGAVEKLPGALAQTTDTLGRVERFARVLAPSAEALRPAARALDDSNTAVRALARQTAPILRTQVRPFVQEARPLARRLQAPARQLAGATPDLTRSFKVLNNLFNMLGYNRDGREGPEDRGRDEGFLFWIAWLGHNGAAVFGTSDANGPMRPITIGAKCQQLKALFEEEFGAGLGMLIAPALMDERVCGGQTGIGRKLRIPENGSLTADRKIAARKRAEGR